MVTSLVAIPTGRITSFKSPLYSNECSGIVFRNGEAVGGVPLGGLGTGYIEYRSDGKLGEHTIFNNFLKPASLDHCPFEVRFDGQARRLCSDDCEALYWGRFPVAEGEFRLSDGFIGHVLAFSPFVLGETDLSNIPAAFFRVTLANNSSKPLRGTLHASLPDSLADDSRVCLIAGDGMSSFEIGPHQAISRDFAIGWSSPAFRDSNNKARYHNYSFRFPDAAAAAQRVLDEADEILRHILDWQDRIYGRDYPDWLKDTLVNSLYSLAKNTLWLNTGDVDSWWPKSGLFTHSESFTGCPITETMVCRFHGHFPALLFFPELEKTTLEAFRHYQLSSGEIPFSFGRPNGFDSPHYMCQHPINSTEYVQLVHRLYLRNGDAEFLQDFYGSVKLALEYAGALDTDGDGLVNDQPHPLPGESWPANQFYDIWPWKGASAYVAGIYLSALLSGEALAQIVGDSDFARRCRERFEAGLRSFDKQLWSGSYYRLWHDTQSGESSEVCLANQLMAEWCCRILGIGGVFPPDKAESALQTVLRLNFKATEHGLVNGCLPDGSPDAADGDHAKHIFIGENLCAAMTMMQLGMREQGIEVARRLCNAVCVVQKSPWNWHCLINREDGKPVWGANYYSDLAIWALPIAFDGADIGSWAL